MTAEEANEAQPRLQQTEPISNAVVRPGAEWHVRVWQNLVASMRRKAFGIKVQRIRKVLFMM